MERQQRCRTWNQQRRRRGSARSRACSPPSSSQERWSPCRSSANAAEPVGTATLTEVNVPGTLHPGRCGRRSGSGRLHRDRVLRERNREPLQRHTAVTTTATVLDSGHPYTTRVVVRTPSAEKFNGTLVVEWNNVTIGVDGEFVFAEANEYLLREGYAVAAVSAQRTESRTSRRGSRPGTGAQRRCERLRQRRTSLCTGDPLSWDIFTQVAKAVADNSGGALAGLDVENVIATGQSQSGSRLANYYNTIQPIYDYFDGFVYHDRASRLRGDVATPAVRVDSDALDSLGILAALAVGHLDARLGARGRNARIRVGPPVHGRGLQPRSGSASQRCADLVHPVARADRAPSWTPPQAGNSAPSTPATSWRSVRVGPELDPDGYARTGVDLLRPGCRGSPIRNAQHISLGRHPSARARRADDVLRCLERSPVPLPVRRRRLHDRLHGRRAEGDVRQPRQVRLADQPDGRAARRRRSTCSIRRRRHDSAAPRSRTWPRSK